MKKVLLGFIVFGAIMVLSTSNSLAQYEKGDKLLNVGLGLNSGYVGGLPLNASFEVGITEDISVGAFANYLGFTGGSYTGIGGRGSYHVNRLLNLNNDKIDLYGGLGLGYFNLNYDGGFIENSGKLFLTGFIGGRYYFKPNLAGFLELGGGALSNANLGLTFKF